MDNIYIEQLHNLFMLLSIPLVSCCISTWNRVDDLRKCVESIQSQSYPNIEIVIVDNCSTDGTFEYCMGLGCTYHRMKDSKSTAMETLNLAFSMASGEYILVLDDDAEMIDLHTIIKLIDYMEFDKCIAIMGVDVIGEDKNSQVTYHGVNNTSGPFYYFDFKGACAMFRTSQVAPLGFYNESFKLYMNEFDLSCKVMKAGYQVMIHGGVKVLHHGKIKLGNSSQYLNNYNTVLYNNFYKKNVLKMVVLNYFIVSYYTGKWFTNALITAMWLFKTMIRTHCNYTPLYWQETLLNGTIRSIKESL